MFLRLPFESTGRLQQTVLVLNTIILLVALVVVELVYADTPKEKRRHLRYFYPLFVMLGALLAYAGYKQVKGG